MSTKIYNAYRTTKKLPELIELFTEIRKKILVEVFHSFHNTYKNCLKDKSIDYIANELRHGFCASTYNKYGFDYNCSALIYIPNPDIEIKDEFKDNLFIRNFYSIFPTSNVDGIKQLFNLENYDGIYDFHYQNQADPPEDIPEEEFEYREKVWEQFLRDYNTKNIDYGLLYQFVSEHDLHKFTHFVYDFQKEKQITEQRILERFCYYDS